MPLRPANLTAPRAQAVQRLTDELGFALVGIAPAEPTHYAQELRAWLSQGKHGQMDYLLDQLEERLDPGRLVPGAKAIICVADVYGKAQGEETPEERSPVYGQIARYAWGNDYHRVIKKRLHALADALRARWPEFDYRTTVDTAPILEREHAQRAGLGWVGKNTLLLHPALGSYLLLGEIVTTMPIQTSAEAGSPNVTDHCGTCTRCLDACPTGCITPHSVDASRCISYLTLEHRSLIPLELHAPMGNWIAGCDICQEVCPYNAGGGTSVLPAQTPQTQPPHSPTPHPAYTPRYPAPAVPLLDLLHWDAPARQRAFERSALKRLKLDQLKRNALIAAGNHLARHADAALLERVRALADDPAEPPLVSQTARQVLERLFKNC